MLDGRLGSQDCEKQQLQMARLTREQSRQRTRERLLEAAEQVFAREGYAAASVEQIAEHAEYSKGAVYSNFVSKEALFLALLERNMDRDQKLLREISVTSTSAAEILDGLTDRYRILEDKQYLCLLVTEFQMEAGRHKEVAQPFAELFRRQRRVFAQLITLLFAKAGTPAPIKAEDLATTIMAMVGGLALQRAADPRSVNRKLVTQSVRLFLQNLLPKENGVLPESIQPVHNSKGKRLRSPRSIN